MKTSIKQLETKERIINKVFGLLCSLMIVFVASCANNDDDIIPPSVDYTTVKNLLNDINFNGYAIVTKNGNDLVRQGFGVANQETGINQDYNLYYRIASVTKTITAAAVVQLKRDGLISSFQQTLDEFDANFPNGHQITIAQLLSHQSGIPDYQVIVEEAYNQGENYDQYDIYELIKHLIEESGLNFSPGSSKQYSNSNFLIAALLVEQLAQIPFHDYVQHKIFNPLEMIETYKGKDLIQPEIHAQGYNNQSINSAYPMVIAYGVGDFSSSPKDMELWINAVKNNWFTQEEKAAIFAQNVPNGFVDFGFGWFTTQEGNTTMYWHGGDINGYWSMIGFIPKYNATIVLLSNHQDDSGVQRNTIIEQLLTKEFN